MGLGIVHMVVGLSVSYTNDIRPGGAIVAGAVVGIPARVHWTKDLANKSDPSSRAYAP